jgi:hypothetical protein
MSTIALGIPYTPWEPQREANMVKLREILNTEGKADFYREFTERAANSVWSEQLWNWQFETGADWGVEIQDDVQIPKFFWPALRAMLSAVPADAKVIGLTSVHPLGREIARRGHRWYRTPGNIVGWAWAIRREALGDFLEFRAQADDEFRGKNEDDQLGTWCARQGFGVWHPVPTIVDQNTAIPSNTTWGDGQSLRRSSVNWRAYSEGEMTDPSWWLPSGVPSLLPMPEQKHCWMCLQAAAHVTSQTTGCGLCGLCIYKSLGGLLGLQVK